MVSPRRLRNTVASSRHIRYRISLPKVSVAERANWILALAGELIVVRAVQFFNGHRLSERRMLRRLGLEDVEWAAAVHRASFDHALPALAGLHTPEEDRWFFR